MPARPSPFRLASLLPLVLACAEASAPLPPPEEVLLVVNRNPASLSVIPVASPTSGVTIPLGNGTANPASASAAGGIAVVPLGAEDSAAVVDLATRAVIRHVPLPAGAGANGAAIVDDSIVYVANPALNTITRINYLTGDTASVAVGVYPQALVYTRGKIFVLEGNLVAAAVAGASWVSVVDPVTNRLVAGVDSIPLPGPGNAMSGTVAQDGVLYIMNQGAPDGSTAGRLSLVDPVGRTELGNFGGLGNGPGAIATNGFDRLFISSRTEGLMEFDMITRKVTRGAGNGISIPSNTAVTVDAAGRVYAIESGGCPGILLGVVHILRPDLTEIRAVTAGGCASAALITTVPPAVP